MYCKQIRWSELVRTTALAIFFTTGIVASQSVEDALSAKNLTTDGALVNESRVRYILADLSLGGPLWVYRAQLHDLDAKTAVRRWDEEVRVVNLHQFTRVKKADGKWIVAYAGTSDEASGSRIGLTSDYCRTKTVSGFAVCRALRPDDGDDQALRAIAQFAASKAVGIGVEQGLKFLGGLLSQTTGLVAGHVFGVFNAFIGAMPTVGMQNRLDVAFLYAGEAARVANVPAGTPVTIFLTLVPGDELQALSVRLTGDDGSVVYSQVVPYDELADVWSLGSAVVLVATNPIVLSQPGKYNLVAACGSGKSTGTLRVL